MSISEEEQQVKGCLSVFVAPIDIVVSTLMLVLKSVVLSYTYSTLIQPAYAPLPAIPWPAFSGFLLVAAPMRYRYEEDKVKQEEKKSVRD